MEHLSRRRFVEGGLALAGLGLLSGCGLPPSAGPMARSRRIGILSVNVPGTPVHLQGLLQGLRELGWAEGQNLSLEYRWAEGRPERLADLAAELARLPVEVIVGLNSPATVAATQATGTVPVVFIGAADPVRQGLVAGLARPGGNATGVSLIGPQLSGKRLELLRDVVPRLARLAALWNPTNPGTAVSFEETSAAAGALRLRLQSLEVRTPEDLEGAFDAATREGAQAVTVLNDTLVNLHRARIAELAAQSRLPAIYDLREYAEAGGLLAYGPSFPALGRRAAAYVDKILKGASPADLPVEQPTTFDFILNQKAAGALGLTFPQSVLLQATEIIQ